MKSYAVRNVVIVSLLVLTSSAALQAADMLAIKVIDKATGKPMPDVKLQYNTFPGGTAATISLGEKGEAFLFWAGVNKYRLVFQFTIDEQQHKIHRAISAADANAGTLTLEIPTTRYKKPLIVTLVDSSTGKPVANARIRVKLALKGVARWLTQMRDTSAKGEAVFRWLGEGKYEIRCLKINGRRLINHSFKKTLTETDWKAGRVTWKIDVPRLSARIKVFILSKGKKTPAPDGVSLRIYSKAPFKSPTRRFGNICKNGEVHFYGLKIGWTNTFHWLSRLWHDGLCDKYAVIDAKKPWVFKGKVLDLTVTLIPPEYRGELAIKVVDERGTPISDATVTLFGDNKIEGNTDVNGVAVFKDIEAYGDYHGRAEKKGYHYTRYGRMQLPGSKGTTVTLYKKYALNVMVVDQNGKPANVWQCLPSRLPPEKYIQEVLTTDDKGKLRFEKLYRGKYLIVAYASDDKDKNGHANWFAKRASAIVEIPTDKSVKLVLRQQHVVNIQITPGKEKMRRPSLIFFISPDQKDVTYASGAGNVTAQMFKGTYLVFYEETNKRFMLLGERTVTGPGTMKFDLSAPALKKAPRFSVQEVLAYLLPKNQRPKVKPPSTMPARATSRPAR